MTITISKEEIKDIVILKKKVELHNAKERIRLLELKYKKKFLEFEAWMKQTEEKFEVWDDYLQWKAYEHLVKDLIKEIADVDNATDIQIT